MTRVSMKKLTDYLSFPYKIKLFQITTKNDYAVAYTLNYHLQQYFGNSYYQYTGILVTCQNSLKSGKENSSPISICPKPEKHLFTFFISTN